MSAQKTVYVIGAGCSKEFGFDLGSELLTTIWRNVTDAADNQDSTLGRAIAQQEVNRQALAPFARGLHSFSSVDQ